MMDKSERRPVSDWEKWAAESRVYRSALKHIESVCVAGLTHEEAQNTITWVRECAREALETEV